MRCVPVTALMQPKTEIAKKEDTLAAFSTSRIPRSSNPKPPAICGGLGVYIANPDSFPSSVVVSATPEFVIIRDLYPKASVHLLVLPRAQAKTHLHPFAALDGSDPAFLAAVQVECSKARQLAASELRRLFGQSSTQDQLREANMSSTNSEEDMTTELPAGRDWSASVMVGVHSVPSMDNLHIHVISIDRHSSKLKHRKHYNSFSTPFFVPLSDFPLAEDDVRRWPGKENYLAWDFICWRCGANFGKKFTQLKAHLESEFVEWKQE